MSDIFALGGVLFFLLTGGPPFQGTTWQEVLGHAQRCEWNRELLITPGIPAPLAAICTRAMAAEPTARFSTAIELAEALETFASRPQRLRRMAAMVTIAFAVLAALWALRPNSTSPRRANQVSTRVSSPDQAQKMPQPAVNANLKIRVHRDAALVELNNAVPLPTGGGLSIESNIPPGLSVMLFAINGVGQLQHVASLPKHSSTRRWRYPEAADATVPLLGPAGTECLILIGQATETVSMEQIKAAWGTNPEWPSLPPATVLRLVGTEVIREQVGRDLGPPQSTSLTPADQITRTLERFARQLGTQCPLVEGLAFSHIEAAE